MFFPSVVFAIDGPIIQDGWDWTLPAHVKAVDYSGFITWGSKRFDPSITVHGVMASWARLNPSPDSYNWDWLRNHIMKNKAAGMRTGIHLKGVQREAVPDWVVERYKPFVLDVPFLEKNQPWRIKIVPPWQPDIEKAFNQFLREFAKTGISQSDDVVYGYIHGISASRGEEMFIRPVDWQMWKETTSINAEQFADWLRRRIDVVCNAFKGVEYKLAIMWGGPLGPTQEIRTITANLPNYAFKKGTGIRGGGIDFMHAFYNAPAWGSITDNQGYVIVDDDHPTINENRFRADENEEYGKYWEWRFGPVEGFSYRHRISTLRGLQMRQNFQLVSPGTLALNPKLNEYARIIQGYRRENSPDAWAYLREVDHHGRPIKNIERWLVQRDAPGSQSVPAEIVDRFPLPSEKYLNAKKVRDFDARRTDLANNQNGLLFALDRIFWKKPQPAVIKVTYTDRVTACWHVEYTDKNGKILKTSSVENKGDNRRKTATFQIPSLSASGSFPNDATFLAWRAEQQEKAGDLLMDFRIVTDGPGNVTVTMVRVVKDVVF